MAERGEKDMHLTKRKKEVLVAVFNGKPARLTGKDGRWVERMGGAFDRMIKRRLRWAEFAAASNNRTFLPDLI